MSGAVQIPTESYDEMEPVGHDKRYEVFGKLHDYLHKTFPKVCVFRGLASWSAASPRTNDLVPQTRYTHANQNKHLRLAVSLGRKRQVTQAVALDGPPR